MNKLLLKYHARRTLEIVWQFVARMVVAIIIAMIAGGALTIVSWIAGFKIPTFIFIGCAVLGLGYSLWRFDGFTGHWTSLPLNKQLCLYGKLRLTRDANYIAVGTSPLQLQFVHLPVNIPDFTAPATLILIDREESLLQKDANDDIIVVTLKDIFKAEKGRSVWSKATPNYSS